MSKHDHKVDEWRGRCAYCEVEELTAEVSRLTAALTDIESYRSASGLMNYERQVARRALGLAVFNDTGSDSGKREP